MPVARRLNVKTIDAAKPKDRPYRLPDGAGLYLTIQPTGSKRFHLRYRDVDGKDRWMLLTDAGLDTWPALSLERARVLAIGLQAERKAGVDPRQAKKAARLEEQIRLAERLVTAKDKLARPTVQTLFETWCAAELAKRKDGGAETIRGFKKDVLPKIGTMPAESVKQAHVMAILDAVIARGSNRMAKRFLSELRQMFGFALDREIVPADPTARIKKDRIGGKAVIRERHLSEDEIRDLARLLPTARLLKTTELAVWIMLATCCRVGELSRARWSDIDLGGGIWAIPTAHAKNGRAFVIRLSDFAREQFQLLKKLKTHDDWMFPNRSGKSHVDLKSISKQIHDRQRATPLRNRSAKTGTLQLAGGPWTPHDLRRTGATLMGNLGVAPYVIERCLNHVEPNRLVRTYQHQKLVNEQAAAWQILGERLHLLTTQGDNLVVLPARAA